MQSNEHARTEHMSSSLLEHVHLGPHKAAQDVILSGLGRISCIAGTNNSGKTSLLEAIAHASAYKLILIEKTRQAKIVDAMKEIYDQQQITMHPDRIKQFVGLTVGNKLLGQDSPELKADYLITQWRAFEPNYPMFFPNLLDMFQTSMPSLKLVEAKRTITSPVKLALNQDDILNRLTVLKNTIMFEDKSEAIQTAFADVTEGAKYYVQPKTVENSLELLIDSGRGYEPASECGLGYQDVLVLLWSAIDSKYDLLLVEEPDNHLHPEMTRRLLSYLDQFLGDRQLIMTAHTNAVISHPCLDSLFLTRITGEADRRNVEVQSVTAKGTLLRTLGYSVADNLLADAVLLVEGPNDVDFFSEIIYRLGISKEFSIRIWPVGGGNMARLDDLSVFTDAYSCFAIVDRDPGSASAIQEFVESCNKHNIPIHVTERVSTESYIDLAEIRRKWPEATVPDAWDPQKPWTEQVIGANLKNNCGLLAKHMDLTDFASTDVHAFLVERFSEGVRKEREGRRR